MKKLTLALLMCISTPAVAADMVTATPFDWTGLSIGLGVGGTYAFSDQQGDVFLDATYKEQRENLLRLDAGDDAGAASFLATGQIGYDWQFAPTMVLGVLANYDIASNSMSGGGVISSGLCPSCDAGVSLDTKVGNSWAIAARIGWLPTERTMLYALGGFTEADIHQDGSIFADLGPSSFKEGVGGSGWQSGWVVGGGVETMLSDNWSIKGEYRYADYGSLSSHREEPLFQGEGGSIDVGGDRSDSVTEHSVRAVISYRMPLM